MILNMMYLTKTTTNNNNNRCSVIIISYSFSAIINLTIVITKLLTSITNVPIELDELKY